MQVAGATGFNAMIDHNHRTTCDAPHRPPRERVALHLKKIIKKWLTSRLSEHMFVQVIANDRESVGQAPRPSRSAADLLANCSSMARLFCGLY